MDSLPERLRQLTHNKYFAVIAIVFFAFLTALIFALFSIDQTQPLSPDDIRSDIQGSTNDYSPEANAQTAGQKKQSPLDTLISVITGKKQDQPSGNSTNQPEQDKKNPEGSNPRTEIGSVAITSAVPKKLDEVSSLPPQISVNKHVLVTQLPEKPASMSIYQLKKGYSIDEIKSLAENLGFASIDGVEQGEKLVQVYDIDSGSFVSVNPDTGRFTYLSETGFRPTLPTASLLQLGKNVVSQIGIDNPTIKPYATYKRDDDDNDYTYIELHAQWDIFGGPILNPLGMLNLSETADIKQVSLGTTIAAPYENVHIIDTSDGTDGYARRSDFNTITVKYLPADGKIYGVSSNIPKILTSEVLTGATVKSPTQAYNEYVSGKTTFSTVGPSGVGTVSLNDIYSGGSAMASTVDVTDIEFIYATGPQTTPAWWCPVYVFRSFGKVQTGFESQFIHTVPATDDPRCQSAVLGLMAQKTQTPPTQVPPTGGAVLSPIVGTGASSLQYGTAEFIYQIVVDTPTNDCPTDFNHSYKITETNDQIEYMMWIDKNTTEKSRKDRSVIGRDWWYVVKRKAGASLSVTEIKPTKSKSQLADMRSRLVLSEKCTIGNASDCPLPNSYQGLETVSCQYITTGSPWIHVYPEKTQDMTVSINPIGGIAYVQPAFTGSSDLSWSFTADRSGRLAFQNSITKNALHWEYYKYPLVQAYKPTMKTSSPGFSIPSEEIKPFVSELARRIGLNNEERDNLLSELNRQSSSIDKPYVKISFVSEEFLNTYLPLTVTPKPDSISRIYLEIIPTQSRDSIPSPRLPHIDRSGSVVVETGVIFPY